MLLAHTDSRIRHKKCDEKIPACTLCSITGRKCDFLSSTPTTTTTKSSITSMYQRSIPQIHPSSLLQPILAFQLQERDEPHFEYFKHVGVKEFGVYFSDNINDNDNFWETTLFQAIQHEPFVLHAVLALAAFGRERYHPLDQYPNKGDSYAVQEYNTSICSLNERIDFCVDGEGLELAVLGTHLFVAVEMFWSRVPRVEGLLGGMCEVLRGTKGYFPGEGESGWEGFRCGGNTGMERLLRGLAEVARQIAWFRSFEGEGERGKEEM